MHYRLREWQKKTARLVAVCLALGLCALVTAGPAVADTKATTTANTTAIAARTTMATKTATVTPGVKPPASECSPSNDGEIRGPDESGIYWECWCQRVSDYDVLCQWWRAEYPGSYGTFIDVNSGLYLDVTGPSTSDGAQIHQWTYTGVNNQWWNTAVGPPNGFTQITSAYSGSCVGVSGGSLSQGAHVVQWHCDGSSNQEWGFVPTGASIGGYPVFNIVDMNSHMCLGISGGSIDVGAIAVQWDCNGSPDQEWY